MIDENVLHLWKNLFGDPEIIDLTLVTYPRSGSNFLFHYLKHTTDINVMKTHDKIFNNKNIVTIIRDPFDSIASMVTMQYQYLETYKDIESIAIIGRINEYKDFYNYLLQNIEFVIDFNNIENKIDEISTKICNYFGANKISSIEDENKFEWFKKTAILEEGNIPTSKDNKFYEFIKECLNQYNLDSCYKLYNRALLKSVI
jgi:hypothetical protein